MTHLAKPAITILMTVFNAESYLAVSIESIQRQTFSDWEFIIVDDASTDRSLAIAESYAEKDLRIKIIRNAINKGQTRCLNQGLVEARGSLVARQDADDLSHLQRLEKQWKRFQQEPTLVLLGTCGLMINQEDDLIGILDKPLTHEVICWSAAIANPFLHTSVMFRADVVRALGDYDEDYQIAQDYDLWARIMGRYRVANLPERLISYRHLESSLSKSGKNKAFQEAQAIAMREEKNSFGRELKPQERCLIQAFREGESVNQQEFMRVFKNLQSSFTSASQNDRRRLRAIYYLQGAGSKKQSRYDQLRGVMAACLAAPFYTFQWLQSRFCATSRDDSP
ncbi:MAG: glycosyltransferase [Verrucomicrobia bacterium]|nr:glycosyltransferase [Verrucomicrobiota bacterium]